MDQVDVDVVQTEPAQRVLECTTGLVATLLAAAQLGGHDKLGPINRRLGDTATDPDLVVVACGGVEEPVAGLDRETDHLWSVGVVQLSSAIACGRDSVRVVQRQGGHGGRHGITVAGRPALGWERSGALSGAGRQ